MNKETFKKYIHSVISKPPLRKDLTYKYFALFIYNEEIDKEEIIINDIDTVKYKLEYILNNYDEDMKLKNNKNIKIVDADFFNKFEHFEKFIDSRKKNGK